MGTVESSPKLNQKQIMLVPQQDNVDPKFEGFVRKAFLDVAVDGKFKQHKFQEALRVLENFNIIRLTNTPLGTRMFSLLDPGPKGEIKIDNFLHVVSLLMKDREKRIQYTFQAYDKTSSGVISSKDFTDFMEDSWLSAFRILGELIATLQMKVQLSTINSFAQNNLQSVTQQSLIIFKKYDYQQKGAIDLQAFRQFMIHDSFNQITAQYEKIVVKVPLTLLNFYQGA